MVLYALQPQDLVLGGTALRLGGGQLIARRLQLPSGCRLRRLGVLQPLMQLPDAAVQPFQLRCPAKHSGTAADRAAGHGAAPVDDLSVQRHDAESVAVFPRHGDTTVQILRNDVRPSNC